MDPDSPTGCKQSCHMVPDMAQADPCRDAHEDRWMVDTELDLHRGLPRGCSFAQSQPSCCWVGKSPGSLGFLPAACAAQPGLSPRLSHSPGLTPLSSHCFSPSSGEARLRPLPSCPEVPSPGVPCAWKAPVAPLDPCVRRPAAQEAACPHSPQGLGLSSVPAHGVPSATWTGTMPFLSSAPGHSTCFLSSEFDRDQTVACGFQSSCKVTRCEGLAESGPTAEEGRRLERFRGWARV